MLRARTAGARGSRRRRRERADRRRPARTARRRGRGRGERSSRSRRGPQKEAVGRAIGAARWSRASEEGFVARPSCPSRSGPVAVRVARPRGPIGRDCHRGNAMGEEPALLACGERNAEIDQLRREARQCRAPSRSAPRLAPPQYARAFARANGPSPLSPSAGCPRPPRLSSTTIATALREERGLREALRAGASVRSRVRRDQHERVALEPAPRPVRRREAAGELEQCGGTGALSPTAAPRLRCRDEQRR